MAHASPVSGWSHRALLTPFSRALGVVVIVGSFFFPIGGLGFDVCWLHAATGLPCPGCGMTRAIAAVSQGEWAVALGANPFVVFAWPLFLALAVTALLPSEVVRRLEARLDARGPGLTRAYRVVAWAFVGFGLLRFTWFLFSQEWFP